MGRVGCDSNKKAFLVFVADEHLKAKLNYTNEIVEFEEKTLSKLKAKKM